MQKVVTLSASAAQSRAGWAVSQPLAQRMVITRDRCAVADAKPRCSPATRDERLSVSSAPNASITILEMTGS
jgi:hypothetical protein